MYLLLYESLPLRTTRMLGDFADDRVLPHRLGDLRKTRFHLLELSSTEWFAADHAMTVSAVQIDDASITGWTQEARFDGAGNVHTVVLLAAPAPPNASVTASGIGRLDDRTGRLIENPADIFEYILRLAGRTEIFPQLRAEAAAQGIVLAGSLDVSKSIRSWLDEVAYSCGAIWIPEAARLYPTADVTGPVVDLDVSSAENVVVSADIEDTCDILRVSYNVDESNDRALRYVELSARPYRYGGIGLEVVLKWCRTPANAESIGRRMLRRMAGELYTIVLTTTETVLRPCQWARLVDHPGWPIDNTNPEAMVLVASVTPGQAESQITLEHIGRAPTVVVTAYSAALPFELGAAVSVAVANGILTLGVGDDQGRPVKDALVSLDGGAARKTDGQGFVRFPVTPAVPPRKHLIAIEAPGMMPFVMDVFL